MATILDKIAAYKREEIAAAKAAMPLDAVEELAQDASILRPFRAALEAKIADGKPGLIAEIKRASPSKGVIRADFDPPELARAYQTGGAACLSVLTDGPSFQGQPAYLTAARGACALPVLAKDFLFDPYQVAQARAWGADCILIILAAVTDTEARALAEAAHDWGMDVLAEVHNWHEMGRALALEPQMLGINNRDLKTFQTSLEVTTRLAAKVPEGTLVVSESGISTHADIKRLGEYDVSAFLVGESLMRQTDVVLATRMLLEGDLEPEDAARQVT
ncbi:Indole-3-glycerol phosphate synthase [hydrothermal vent metagenome]|uniref:indole-3-glycerol-phosphate synthase n=1 Tax=hydrothermal vent metagenome TaxID=652676 RepID=A0A3B0TP64_9ZZZZ